MVRMESCILYYSIDRMGVRRDSFYFALVMEGLMKVGALTISSEGDFTLLILSSHICPFLRSVEFVLDVAIRLYPRSEVVI